MKTLYMHCAICVYMCLLNFFNKSVWVLLRPLHALQVLLVEVKESINEILRLVNCQYSQHSLDLTDDFKTLDLLSIPEL